ncbi:hypothetical protein [Methylobacterium bullatum]|uniref:Uncharacterized protein n=1 Tax=Methylobacterium bullatum TaxID=570505 RepID=A0AAV4ZC09_9HYPH|nr:hypothetical protein [Methylobacterium bullatum]MBD8902757.1 hypothetical protein [Methylobacterium bullatum]GJD41337.1 hypothetical protein OICFNHDK_3820 [Methylobacterium bullatum]
MTGCDFHGLGPFADNLTNAMRGKLALRLTKACAAAPEARPAAIALGRVAEPARRAEALAILNAMPSLPRRYVLSRYAALSKLSKE